MNRLALLATLALSIPALALDNELTPAEKRDGWILLFNGHTTEG